MGYRILAFAVFIAGAVIMSMEMLAGRLLAPTHGDSIIVWGTIIGIFLVGLSIGYHVGGLLADSKPKKNILALIFAVEGLLIFFIPFLYDVLSTTALLTASALFLLPSILAGMITPYALKLAAHDLKTLGKTAGNLYAIATVGSVIGVFGTIFYLITLLPTTELFWLLGFILVAFAAILVPFQWGIPAAILLLLLVTGRDVEIPEEGLTLVLPSAYGDVKVWDLHGVRRMSINGGQMSTMNLSDREAYVPSWEYVRCMESAFVINTAAKDVLLIGGGAGTYARNVQREYGARVDISEINPVVAEVAETHFGFVPSGNVYVEDGRVVVRENGPWDIIAMDVMHYLNKSYKIPYHLGTQEFFLLAKSKLNKNGALVLHVDDAPENLYIQSLVRTLRTVFSQVHTFNCSGSQVFLAYDHDVTWDDEHFFTKYKYEPIQAKGLVLTDEFSPIIFSHETSAGEERQ